MWYLTVRTSQINTTITNMGVVGVYMAHGIGNIFEKLYTNKRNDFANGTGFMQNALPYKLASVHFCFDSNFGSAIQKYIMMALGRCARVRLRSHCGKKQNRVIAKQLLPFQFISPGHVVICRSFDIVSPSHLLGSRLECEYALKSFGIDIDTLRTSPSASVQKWLERCKSFDKIHRDELRTRILPRPNDVLLGRGRPFQLYSGNLALTAKIDENRARYATAKKMHKKTITIEIVERIHESGGRFLRKNSGKNGNMAWEEVDFETARLKVSHSFRTTSKGNAGSEDIWNHGGKGGEEILADPISSILAADASPLGFLATSNPSNGDSMITQIHFESSNKRRKW